MSRSALAAIGAVTLAVVLVVASARHAITRFAFERVADAATGTRVHLGDVVIGGDRLVLTDVHVTTSHGDPLADVARIDVDEHWRDLLPGGTRVFGLRRVRIERPVLWLVRRADGRYNLADVAVPAGPSGTSGPPPALRFTASVRDGAIVIVDRAPLEADLAEQRIADLNADAQVDLAARTTLAARAAMVARQTADRPLQSYPLAVRSTTDVLRGFTATRLRAAQIPLRGLVNFLVHAPVARFDDGVVDRVDVRAYGVGAPGTAYPLRLGGGADLADTRITVSALAKPVRDLRGHLDLFDDGMTTSRLEGDVAGIPLHMRGGLFDFAHVHFDMGIGGDAELAQLRHLFAFLDPQPVRGRMHLQVHIASTVDDPLIRSALDAQRVDYGTIPLDHLHGIVDYQSGNVTFTGVHIGMGPIRAVTSGNVDVHRPNAVIDAFVDGVGPAAQIPYAQAVASDATVDGSGVVEGTGRGGFRAAGTIAMDGPRTRGLGFVRVDERGVGEFGPFTFDHRDGSTLSGAFRIERPASRSGGWLVARDYRLDVAPKVAVLPGIAIPPFPDVGGIIDATVVGGGPPSAFTIAGHAHARNAAFQTYALGDADLDLAGRLDDLRLQHVRVDGPIGHFAGDGAVNGGLFALAGGYDGGLQRLVPFTGDIGAAGPVRAPVRAVVDARGITVQTVDAAMPGDTIHGFPLDRASGTMRIDAAGVRIVAADADVRGHRAVAASTDHEIAVSASALPAAALAATGVPLVAGRLSLFGVAAFPRSGLTFAGGVDLEDGVARGGYGVAGWADLSLAGPTLAVREGVGHLGSTYGRLGGRLDGLDGPAPRYDLDATVPLGDVARFASDLRLALPVPVAGSFAANVHVGGSGGAPHVDGTVELPEASINGLDIADGAGLLHVAPAPVPALAIDHGRVRVRDTALRFAAALAPGATSLHVASAAADLSDFDDVFDTSGSLAGRGAVALTLASAGGVRTWGRLALTGVRFRRSPFGDVDATWGMRGPRVATSFRARGPEGSFGLTGTLTPSAGALPDALLHGSVDADASASRVDLGTWLPALGLTVPVLGRLDAAGHVRGAFPHLAVGGSARVENGFIGPYAVSDAHLQTRIVGERIGIEDGVLDLGFAHLTAAGTVGIDADDPLGLRIHASVPDVADAAKRLARVPPDVGGLLEADALIGGTLRRPAITAGFDLENAHYGAFNPQHVIGDLETDLRSVRLDNAEIGFEHGSAVIAGSLPLELSPPGIGPASAPLSLTAEARNVDLTPLAPLLPGSGTKLGGILTGRIALSGTVGAPRIFGSATLAGGSYVSALESSPIRGLDAQVAFGGTSVELDRLHGSVGKGTIDGSGRFDLPIPGAPPSGYAIRLAAHDAQIAVTNYGGGTLDGTADLISGVRRPTLSGNVTVSDATIPFATIFRAGAGGGEESGPPFDLALDLHGVLGKNVRVRSPIIDVGASGSIDLGGTLLAPRASGVLTANRGGFFSTYSRLFRIQSATVTFDPTQGIVPNLDLVATAHVTNPDPDTTRNTLGSADITVTVHGPADAFTVAYASEPAYSQTQILALLTALPLVGVVNFNQPLVPGTLRGAPGEFNVLLPPGVTPYQSGVYSFQQEAFSLLDTQLTQRFISPIENAFSGALGLTDLDITIDYGGRVGYTATKQIAAKQQLAISLGQVLSYPVRTQIGVVARPDAVTSASFSYFTQNGTPSYQNSIFGTSATVQVLNGVQPLSNRQGFSAEITRSYP